MQTYSNPARERPSAGAHATSPNRNMIYAHLQDFVDAYIGPFNTTDEAQSHVDFCVRRGDSAKLIGFVEELPVDAFVVAPSDDIY